MKKGNKNSANQLTFGFCESKGTTNIEDTPMRSTPNPEIIHSEGVVITMREKLVQLEEKREREIIDYILLNSKRF